MAKNTCNCKNNNYLSGTSSFYLFNRFNTKYVPQNRNPRTDTLLQAQKSALNTERDGNNVCATPWRVPLNAYRKVTSCDTENICKTNVRIVGLMTPNSPGPTSASFRHNTTRSSA